MGLHITKNVVEQFGGEVYAKSKLGQGSTFGFTFELNKNNTQNDDNGRIINQKYVERKSKIVI